MLFGWLNPSHSCYAWRHVRSGKRGWYICLKVPMIGSSLYLVKHNLKVPKRFNPGSNWCWRHFCVVNKYLTNREPIVFFTVTNKNIVTTSVTIEVTRGQDRREIHRSIAVSELLLHDLNWSFWSFKRFSINSRDIFMRRGYLWKAIVPFAESRNFHSTCFPRCVLFWHRTANWKSNFKSRTSSTVNVYRRWLLVKHSENFWYGSTVPLLGHCLLHLLLGVSHTL